MRSGGWRYPGAPRKGIVLPKKKACSHVHNHRGFRTAELGRVLRSRKASIVCGMKEEDARQGSRCFNLIHNASSTFCSGSNTVVVLTLSVATRQGTITQKRIDKHMPEHRYLLRSSFSKDPN